MIEVHPATADRWDDVRTILGPKSLDTPSCWCLSMRISAGDPRVKGRPPRERAEVLRSLCAEEVPPGVLAYVDGEIAGWCSVSPRSSYHRLVRSRVIPRLDDAPVWSVVCFVVRAGYRRQGLAGSLLDGAVEFARGHGATLVEGYPADTGGERIDVASAYVGTRSLFERHGFTMASETSSVTCGRPRVLMRRALD
ncbi:GNAT family N-acetyltransferase [Demequina pelophila]|uniref:GNAT family N-acetyltransferase n=1 Tax=Demequina pelophila TaxID=1638984 RepID=UPI0007863B40|nr:GNAT family N-acetyltransferase [Demequina pelophila]